MAETQEQKQSTENKATEQVTFAPVLPHKHAQKSTPWLSRFGMNFHVSPIFQFFYNPFRYVGYVIMASYGTISRYLLDAAREFDVAEYRPESEIKLSFFKRKAGELTRYLYPKGLPRDMRNAKSIFGPFINRVETVIFSILGGLYSFKEYRSLRHDCRLAVAAEKGLLPEQVSAWDLRASDNPIIASAVDQWGWHGVLRQLGAAAFLHHVVTGVAANAVVITTERPSVAAATAFDILQKTINDAQLNNLGEDSKSLVVNGLVRTLQAAQLNHGRPMLTPEQTTGLKPLLSDIAQDILDRRFGFQGALYILGGGIIVPDNPALSQALYHHVREIGVEGVAKELHAFRKAHPGVPSSKLWSAKDGEKRQRDGYVAESAREGELKRQREEIVARSGKRLNGETEVIPLGNLRA